VDQARFISSREIIDLVGGNANTRKVQLKKLSDLKYVERPLQQQELAQGRGTASLIYALGPKGAEYLGKPVRKNTVSLWYLDHTLFVSRVHSVVFRACKTAGLTLEAWQNEALLPRLTLAWQSEEGEEHSEEVEHRADAHFSIKRTTASWQFFLEVDRASEPQRRSDTRLSHIRKMLLFYHQLWQERELHFGKDADFRVLITVPSIGRLEGVQEVAREIDPKHVGGLGIFWLTTENQIQVAEPGRILEPIWFKASSGPHPLWHPEEPAQKAELPAEREPRAGKLPLYAQELPERPLLEYGAGGGL
jgi:hypothetical protein